MKKMVYSFIFFVFFADTLAQAAGPVLLDANLWQQQLSPLSGQAPKRLADYRGKTIWLDFWASWCGPCRYEFPWLDAMQRRYQKDGFVVLAVSVDEEASEAQRFLKSVPVDFAVFHDPKGVLAEAFAVPGMPTGILIDSAGQVVMRHTGFRKKETDALEQDIRQALGK